MARLQFTPMHIKQASCPQSLAKADFFDLGCRGLMLEVRKSGRKTYYLRYQDERGRTRQFRLANAEDVTLAQARQLAQKTRTRIAMGEDPGQTRAQMRAMPTFASFVEDAYLPYVQTYKRSWRTDVSFLKNHLLPRFGRLYLDEITRESIVRMLQERRQAKAAPGSINRLLILMRFIFNLAIKWETPGVTRNPAKGVPVLEENNKRERYLSVEEAQALREAVSQSSNALLAPIIAMLILTGARKREVLDARWEDFQLEARVWRIAMSKSGRARHVPLSDGAILVLQSLSRLPGVPYAFANPDTGKPFTNIYCAWHTARTRAGLPDVRVHDLRHSFASMLINHGRSLYEVQQILGHTQVKTTQRYAHLQQQTLLDAANTASRVVDHFRVE